MNIDELNTHFKEKIRTRVETRLSSTYEGQALTGPRDFIVGCIVLLADKNDVNKATESYIAILEQQQQPLPNLDKVMEIMTTVFTEYETEVSILYDLYQMQERQDDIMDIIAHMELRLLEDWYA